MEKRSWGGGYDPIDAKRQKQAEEAREDLVAHADLPVEAEFYIEQPLIGWVIGKGGSVAKEIENTFQVKISFDQTTKQLGYSKLRISGAGALVLQAAEHI